MVAHKQWGQHGASSFWLKDYSDTIPELTSPEYLLRLASIRRSIANFIKIITGRDIPVEFSSGNDSYAVGGDHEVIVISATADPAKLDCNVGLALHEAAHLILSKKNPEVPESLDLLKTMRRVRTRDVSLWIDLPSGVEMGITRVGHERSHFNSHIALFMNVIEDRRIDSWMYTNAVGYRPYYDALYKEYWYNPETDALLRNPETHKPYIKNYRFHILNLMNRHARSDVLPGLKDIWKLIDLPNILRFKHEDEIEQAATRIAEIVYTHAEKAQNKNPDQWSDAPKQAPEAPKSAPKDSPGAAQRGPRGRIPDKALQNLPNLDIPQTLDPPSPGGQTACEHAVERILGDLEAFLEGRIPKDALSPEAKEVIDALEATRTEIKEVGEIEKIKCLVFHRLTRSLLRTSIFPNSTLCRGAFLQPHKPSMLAVQTGKRLGLMLASRLQVLADESVLSYSRQPFGRLDKHALARLGYEDEQVFQMQFVERHDPIDVHLSIDASSSMNSEDDRWGRALTLAVCLAQAAQKLRTLDVTISIRNGVSHVTDDLAAITIIYNSKQDTFVEQMKLLEYLVPSGGTPEGLCFEALHNEIIARTHQTTRKYFINLSDGEPAFSMRGGSYSGETAAQHTAKEIQKFRREGITVMSYFIGNQGVKESKLFTLMYGRDARYINPADLQQVAKTLNGLFLGKCT